MTYSADPMPEGTPSYQPHMAASNPGGLAAAFKEPKRPTFVFVFVIFTATVCPILRFVEYVLTSSYLSEAFKWHQSRTYVPAYGDMSLEQMKSGIFAQAQLNSTLTFHFISVLTSALLYILFGLVVNTGKNWGRILLTILASLGVLMSGMSALGQAYTMSDPEAPTFANAQGYLGALVAVYMLLFLANICLVVLVWMPPVNVYMRNSKAYWKAKKALEVGSKSYANRFAAQPESTSKEQTKGTNS